MKYILTGWWGAEDNWSGFNTREPTPCSVLNFSMAWVV